VKYFCHLNSPTLSKKQVLKFDKIKQVKPKKTWPEPVKKSGNCFPESIAALEKSSLCLSFR
jgi:hypothetical protein